MKNLLISKILILFLFFSISCKETEPSNKKGVYTWKELYEMPNEQMDNFVKEVKKGYDNLSEEDKFLLCLQDFSFKYPKEYKKIIDNYAEDIMDKLLESNNFLKLCEDKNIDPHKLPKNYFIKYSPKGQK